MTQYYYNHRDHSVTTKHWQPYIPIPSDLHNLTIHQALELGINITNIYYIPKRIRTSTGPILQISIDDMTITLCDDYIEKVTPNGMLIINYTEYTTLADLMR